MGIDWLIDTAMAQETEQETMAWKLCQLLLKVLSHKTFVFLTLLNRNVEIEVQRLDYTKDRPVSEHTCSSASNVGSSDNTV